MISGLAWLAVYEIAALAGVGLGALGDRSIHDVVLIAATGLCVSGARRHEGLERGAWLMLAAAVASWTAGEIYYTAVLWEDTSPPVPSPADAGYLLFPPLAITGVLRLARAHRTDASAAVRVDGVIAALAVGSLCAAIVVQAVGQADVVALAYPVLDLVLLGVLVGTLTRRRWHVDRIWLLLIGGIAAFFVADSLYAVQVAEGTYASGGPFDAGWWTGLFLVGIAAHQRAPAGDETGRSSDDAVVMAAPMLSGVVGIGVLVVSSLAPLNPLAVGLAAVALLGVMVRLALTLRQSTQFLRVSRSEALTDDLTGLCNRRGLERALAQALEGEAPERWALGLFDLNGFKAYNDTYGHPAGDALLVRLAARLAEAVAPPGRAFRMGGDEFCVLVPVDEEGLDGELERLRGALCERAEGFDITAAAGIVRLCEGIRTPADALRVADQRMYAEKAGVRMPAQRQSAESLELTARDRLTAPA